MISRRSFLIASGMTALASTRVLGANDTVRIGVIGAGAPDEGPSQRCRQSCSLSDRGRRATCTHPTAMQSRNARTASQPPTWIIAKFSSKDIDAVIIASPDHWHVAWQSTHWRRARTSIWKSQSPIPSRKAPLSLRRSDPANRFCNAACSSAVGRIFAMPSIYSGGQSRACLAGANLLVAELSRNWRAKPIDKQALDWKQWLVPLPISLSAKKNSTIGDGSGILAAAP